MKYAVIYFLPATSDVLKKASARSQDMPTADNKSLDIDIIISSTIRRK